MTTNNTYCSELARLEKERDEALATVQRLEAEQAKALQIFERERLKRFTDYTELANQAAERAVALEAAEAHVARLEAERARVSPGALEALIAEAKKLVARDDDAENRAD